MKILEQEGDLNLKNGCLEIGKKLTMSKMDVQMNPDPANAASVANSSKLDSMAELENMIRLIRRGRVKDKKKSKGNDSKFSLKTAENGSQNNNNYPPDPLAFSTLPGKGKATGNDSSDMVEALRQMLDKALQALKICQNRISEANKRQEASQLEIQKLQDEVRNLRAQINPPQLQLMKGISSLSTRSKHKRLRSPSSSDSTSRSTTSSHHSSRRSESPPQLSPAFIPRPVSTSAPTIANSKKRSRYSSPHSFTYAASESNTLTSNIFNQDFQWEDAQFPDSGKSVCYTNSGNSIDPNASQRVIQRFKSLKSNMKNTSHLSSCDSKHSSIIKGRSSSLFPAKISQESTTGGRNQSLLSTVPHMISSSGSMKAKKKAVLKKYGSTRSSSACRIHEGNSLIFESQLPSSKSVSAPTGHIVSKLSKISEPEPPVLENNAESDSEEEFDAFTFAKNDDEDESEELIDIDELPEIPPPSLPPPKTTQKKETGLLTSLQNRRQHNTSLKFSLSHGAHSSGSESLKMPDIRSSASMPSSPISSIGSTTSSKSCRKQSKSTTGLRKFRSSTLNSRAASVYSASSKFLKSRTKLRENRHSYPRVRKIGEVLEKKSTEVTVSPFPLRQFDKKIDYSKYLNGKFPLDSNSAQPSNENGPDSKDSTVIKEEADAPSTSKSLSTRKGVREFFERFSMRLDGSENCMMAQMPYQFYESETTFDPNDGEDDGFKSEKRDASMVEIPSWRERIFETFDSDASQSTDESLDDQIFLKRHTKSEINERRRKRWDSQRMREESYLEKLKRKREERENLKKLKRKRGRSHQRGRSSKDDDLFTFQPLVHDAVYIRNDPELPITVFGYPLPIIDSEEFELPWAVPTKTPKSFKKATETSKTQAPSNKLSGLKTALRQPKR